MSHIHNEPGQYDLTVGAYIVRIIDSEPKAFLHLHKKLNKLLPIGGHVELDETPWQSLLREVEEESGYKLTELKVLQPTKRIAELKDQNVQPQALVITSYDYNSEHNHTDLAFGLIVEGDPSSSRAENESNEFLWLTLKELKDLDESRIFTNTKQIYEFVLEECLNKWEIINASNFKK